MTTDNSNNLTEINRLYEITKALSSSGNLRNCLKQTMKILSESMGLNNGTVTIVNPITKRLEIEVAYGMTDKARKRGKYKIGEEDLNWLKKKHYFLMKLENSPKASRLNS